MSSPIASPKTPSSPVSVGTPSRGRTSYRLGFSSPLPSSPPRSPVRSPRASSYGSMSSMAESVEGFFSDDEQPFSPSSKRMAGESDAIRMGSVASLSEIDRKKCFEVFELYCEGGEDDDLDESSHPYLSLEQFGRAVAALGFKLGAAEVERAFLLLDDTRKGKVSDRKFLEFYAKTLLKHVQENKIRENFDKLVAACGNLSDTHGEPYIDSVQFRRFLTEHGFTLSDEEADELIRECAAKNHRIFYRQYRSMLVEQK